MLGTIAPAPGPDTLAFVHRFGSSLDSHVHFHVLVTDGVFSTDGEGGAVFHPALDLTATDFAAVQAKMRRRGLRWLLRHGHLDDLAVHAFDTPDHAGGWSVDASVTVPGWDRQGLERLVRYYARPPLSGERLGRLNDYLLVYRLRKPTVDGRTELLLTPQDLLDRLARLITPPRRHKHRYCGVLAPNARLRSAVIATAGPAGSRRCRYCRRRGAGWRCRRPRPTPTHRPTNLAAPCPGRLPAAGRCCWRACSNACPWCAPTAASRCGS